MNKTKFIGITLLSILLGACASSNSGGVYSREEARKVQTVRMGVVESVRSVKLEGTKTPIGAAAGAAVGGVGLNFGNANPNTTTINPDITPQEKRQLIDTMYFNMIELSRHGNDILKEINKPK